jgi:hypothetical protein
MPLLKEVFITEISGQEYETAALGDAVHYVTEMIVTEFLGEQEGGKSWQTVYGEVWEALAGVVRKHKPDAGIDYE